MGIAEYIARDSARYASAFVASIRNEARLLKRFAFRGRRVPEVGRDDIREVIVYPYRLIYQIRADDIRILAVMHGARDISSWAAKHEAG